MVIGLLAVVIVLCLAFLPQMWVRRVIADHGKQRSDIPGTGGELARHLLDGMKLTGVKVEETTLGDHYDPETRTVRLLPAHFGGRSLSAVVIAAHEVGHAMQHATGYQPLVARTRLAKQAQRLETAGAIVMLLAPVLLALVKNPAVLVIELIAGLFIMSLAVLIHVVTLPVELDASFRRALPLLEAGHFIGPADMPAARRILRAAAFTYVAAAALGLLDVMRWLRILRF